MKQPSKQGNINTKTTKNSRCCRKFGPLGHGI